MFDEELFDLSAFIFVAFSCGYKEDVIPSTSLPKIIPGGIGGAYNIAIFTLNGTYGVSGKCFIKYACKTKPNPLVYDDSLATMVEPGFGPHAHFFNLKSGFYYISANGKYKGNNIQGDTLIEVRDTQAHSVDFNLQVR